LQHQMNGGNGNGNGRQGAQVVVTFPKAPKQLPPQPPPPCMRNGPPVLSVGCDLCVGCGDFLMSGMCISPGISGMMPVQPCFVYDEQWGGCGVCVGGPIACSGGICPWPGVYSDWAHALPGMGMGGGIIPGAGAY